MAVAEDPAEVIRPTVDHQSAGDRFPWAAVRRVAAVAALLTLIASAAALRLWNLGVLGFNSDEAVYAGQAASLADNPVYRDDFPVFRAHPMLVQSLLLSPFFRSGEHDVVGRVVMAVVGLGTVGLVYLLGRALYSSNKVGLLAAAITALMPYHVVVSRQVLLDGPMVLLSTLTLVCVARYGVTHRTWWLVAAGGSMGLTMLAKESAVVLVGGVYAFMALTPHIRGQLKAVVLAAPLVPVMFLVHPVSMHLAEHSGTGKSYLVWQLLRRPNHGLGFYAETVPWALGPLVVLAAVAAVVLKRRDRSWREVLLVCWIAAPVVAFTVWPVKGFQYLLPIVPAVAVLAARGLLTTTAPPWLRERWAFRGSEFIRTAAVVAVLVSLFVGSFARVTATSSSTFLAGSGGVPGGREAGRWMAEHTPVRRERADPRPVDGQHHPVLRSPQDLRTVREPQPAAPQPGVRAGQEPGLELRDKELQYIVWDSFSAGRSPHFSSKLRELIRRYHGRVAHTEYVHRRSPTGEPRRSRSSWSTRCAHDRGTAGSTPGGRAAGCADAGDRPAARGADGPVGPPPATPIEHFVFLMQENHTFDNYFGTRTGVDGIPAGVCMPRAPGVTKAASSRTGSAAPASRTSATARRTTGAGPRRGDGRLRVAPARKTARTAARRWATTTTATCPTTGTSRTSTCCSTGSSPRRGRQRPQPHVRRGRRTRRDRQERADPGRGLGDLPDDLRPARGEGRHLEVLRPELRPDHHLAYPGRREGRRPGRPGHLGPAAGLPPVRRRPELSSHIVDMEEFYEDAATGNLPAVSYMAPSGNSEHPPGSIRAGEPFVRGADRPADALAALGLVGLPVDATTTGAAGTTTSCRPRSTASATASGCRRCS